MWDLAAIVRSADCPDASGAENWDPSNSAKLWNLSITNTGKGNKEYSRIVADEYKVYAFFDDSSRDVDEDEQTSVVR